MFLCSALTNTAQTKPPTEIVYADRILTSTQGLSSGAIAGIVVGSVAGALLLAALVAIVVRRWSVGSSEKADAAAQIEALLWNADEEVQETKKVNDDIVMRFNKSERAVPVMVDFEVAGSRSSKPTFSVATGTRMPVNHVMLDVMTILNSSDGKLFYRIYLPQSSAFQLTARPGVGSIDAQKFVEIRLLLKLVRRRCFDLLACFGLMFRGAQLYTITVKRYMKIEFSDVNDVVLGSMLIAINIVGDVSTRLNPADIELSGKQVAETDTTISYRGTYRGNTVAVRVLRRQTELTDAQLAAFDKEVLLYEKLRSPYVVNFVGASHEKGKFCLCLEWLDRGTVEVRCMCVCWKEALTSIVDC